MEQTKLEKYLEEILTKEGIEKGKEWYGHYQSARTYLANDILPNISRKEPNLTDHSENHIKNVLDNTWRLLIYDEDNDKYDDIKKLTCYDIYVLCLSILFHDVGNINGREDHNKKICGIYDEIRSKKNTFNTEKSLILNIVKAHCGKTDTLRNVNIKDSLSGEPIQAQEIAGILRFADELAEGPQRTSNYLINANKISSTSKIYHKYANITNPFIDRGNNRIVLQYHIDIKDETEDSLKELLSFAYERIIKLDEERKYTKFHSKLLAPFNKTEFTFNFMKGGEPLDISISESLPDTCVIPGEKQSYVEDLIEKCEELNIDNIIKKLDLEGRKDGRL